MRQTAAIPPDEAAQLLESVRTARHATRGRLRSYWFALVVFGVLTILSAPFFSLWDGGGVALFWLVAAPAGTLAVVRYQRGRAFATGAMRDARPYNITAGALIAACFGLGIIGGVTDQADVASFGPPLAISAAYLVFAWLERSLALALLAMSVAGLTIGLAVADVDHAARILALSYGASFAIVGLLVRPRSPRA
jgi:hypothetical protein